VRAVHQAEPGEARDLLQIRVALFQLGLYPQLAPQPPHTQPLFLSIHVYILFLLFQGLVLFLIFTFTKLNKVKFKFPLRFPIFRSQPGWP